ncbi:MAG: acyl-CoA thioester hydrolase/BAAT C-terminal domain-containing protein [Bacteroidota bacterium]
MKTITLLILLVSSVSCFCQNFPKNYGNLETELFLSDIPKDLLVVAFGGSEGGNTFANEQIKGVREEFLNRGFHFLAIGYFGTKGLPKSIDRISLSAIGDTVWHISQNLGISSSNVLLVGGSRGGELVLNLARFYDAMGVIAMVPSNITIPFHKNKNSMSSWTFNDMQVPFYDIDKGLVKKQGWSKTIENSISTQGQDVSGVIPIEKIKGFFLLTSGKSDQLWPSYKMCNMMIDRLTKKNFEFPFEHIAFSSGHNAESHWTKIFMFLDNQLNKA